MVGLLLLTAAPGQLISNTARAFDGHSGRTLRRHGDRRLPRPFLMALTVVAAAAFLTSVATAANMMMLSPLATGSATTGGSA